MKTIKLVGVNRRGKTRINEHGDTFELLEEDNESILVKSLNNTFHGEKWMGWFLKGNEVNLIKYEDH